MRPQTLAGALVPVMLGASLAYTDNCLNWTIVWLCAFFAGGMQMAANMVNDYYDYRKGTDRSDRLGPLRACAQGWISPSAMLKGTALTMALSSVAGLGVFVLARRALPYGGWELIALGALCLLFCVLYTTTLSYRGWGDLLVLVFFGWVPVCGTYYVMAHSISWASVVLGTVSGLIIDVMLVINNYRDREQDALSGKRTLVVRLGEPFGRYAYLFLGVAAVVLSALLIGMNKISLADFCVASIAYLSLHYATWNKLVRIREGKELNRLLGENSRNMLVYALLLSLILVLNR